MKKSIFKLGALSISLLSLALLFKMMHWPGGNIMLILTLGGLVPPCRICLSFSLISYKKAVSSFTIALYQIYRKDTPKNHRR